MNRAEKVIRTVGVNEMLRIFKAVGRTLHLKPDHDGDLLRICLLKFSRTVHVRMKLFLEPLESPSCCDLMRKKETAIGRRRVLGKPDPRKPFFNVPLDNLFERIARMRTEFSAMSAVNGNEG